MGRVGTRGVLMQEMELALEKGNVAVVKQTELRTAQPQLVPLLGATS